VSSFSPANCSSSGVCVFENVTSEEIVIAENDNSSEMSVSLKLPQKFNTVLVIVLFSFIGLSALVLLIGGFVAAAKLCSGCSFRSSYHSADDFLTSESKTEQSTTNYGTSSYSTPSSYTSTYSSTNTTPSDSSSFTTPYSVSSQYNPTPSAPPVASAPPYETTPLAPGIDANGLPVYVL